MFLYPNPDTSQGSTMYLLEGSGRALLIDTANPAKAVEGVNDLKSALRYLLGHENDGALRLHPLGFVVAITHNHPDHICENGRISDRTIYHSGPADTFLLRGSTSALLIRTDKRWTGKGSVREFAHR